MAKSGVMARTPREVWEKRIERLRDSELTDKEFAAEIGVNVHTLQSWKWKLGRGDRRVRPANARRGNWATTVEAKPTFTEMTRAADASIELRIADVEVRVPIGFDEATLSRVVAVLRQAA